LRADTRNEVLTDPESEALWELAESPSERLRGWFVTEAIARPLGTAQLRGRSSHALIAAVGLDPVRRARAEQALAERMSDGTLPLLHRADIACIALELVAPDSSVSHKAEELIVRAIADEYKRQPEGVLRLRAWLADRKDQLPPATAARLLAAALDKETDNDDRRWLARVLAAVAGRLPPAEAARLLAEALGKRGASEDSGQLEEDLAAAAGRLPPAEATRLLAEALGKQEAVSYGRGGPARGLVAVARRLPPAEAAAVCRPAAQLLANALGERETSDNYWMRLDLACGLAAVAGRLPPAEAAAVCEPPARLLAEALAKERPDDARGRLASCVAAVAGRLPPAEAAHLLTEALGKETDANAYAFTELADGLAAVAGRLPPGEAAAVCGPPARLLAEALGKEKTEAYDCTRQAKRLVTLTDWVERSEADRVCEQALRIVQQREVSTTTWEARMAFKQAASSLVQQLTEEKARSLAFRGASQTAAAPDINKYRVDGGRSQFLDVDNFDCLLSDASHPQRRRGAVATATAVGLSFVGPLPALAALPAACEPLPCRLSTAELGELLKYPTCYGPARQVVLKHLGNRYGRPFANHWEFVRFAQEHHLGLDFTSPAKRPKDLAPLEGR
jgi:hypothetical protein